MIKQLIFFFLIYFSCSINAQVTIKGIVKNVDNNPISYAAIGIKETQVGAIADEKGSYSLSIPPEFENRDLLFSADGYQLKKINRAELVQNSTVNLEFKEQKIEEIQIVSRKLKNKTIGESSRPMLTFSKMFDKDIPTIEQGNIFKIYPKTKLNDYQFHILPSSKFQQITLKLNVYRVKNQQPDQSILSENILYSTSSTGWQKIDLKKYKLIDNNIDKVAITLQLIDFIPLKSEGFIFGISAKKSLAKNLLFRYQSQADWQESAGVFLSNLAISYDKKAIVKKEDAEEMVEISEEEKQLVSFYKGREEGMKTNFGKNPNGKFIALSDAKIYYEAYGSGEPLILLEGNNGMISDYYKQIQDFAKHYQVIVIDTRNQGKSTDDAKENYGYEKLADDLVEIINVLQLKKVKMVGWSDGGITGLIFNYKHPELVDKLVTIGANLNPQGVEDKIIKSTKDLYNNTIEEKIKRRLNLMINYPDITKENLRNITNPVLVIAGDKDFIKEEHTFTISKYIKNSRVEIIKNSTHNVPFDQPIVLNDLILNFLK